MCFVWPKIYCKINHIWLKSLDIFHITFTKENICGTEEEVFFSNHIQNVTHHSQKLRENLYRVYLSVCCIHESIHLLAVEHWRIQFSYIAYYNLVCLIKWELLLICDMLHDIFGLIWIGLGSINVGRQFLSASSYPILHTLFPPFCGKSATDNIHVVLFNFLQICSVLDSQRWDLWIFS